MDGLFDGRGGIGWTVSSSAAGVGVVGEVITPREGLGGGGGESASLILADLTDSDLFTEDVGCISCSETAIIV